MRQIIGLDIGTVVFTPGAAGVGTLVFSSISNFSQRRLMLVSNITRKTLIYAAEIQGKAGVWSSVSTTGGTLTLDVDTTDHNAADVLRPIYEDAEHLTTKSDARNILSAPISDAGWTSNGMTVKTTDYGVGAIPSHKSVRIQANVDGNQGLGVTSPAISLTGRMDGRYAIVSFWAKGTGVLSGLLLFGTTVTVGSGAYTLSASWTRYKCACLLTYPYLFELRVRFLSSVGVVDAEIDGVMVELADSPSCGDYSEPSGGSVVYVPQHARASTSLVFWGDSLLPPNAVQYETTLLLNGATASNKAVGGETSTQIKDRFLIESAIANNVNNYGIVIIGAGRNNYNYPATVIADIAAMVAASVHPRFFVLSIPNATTEAAGSAGHQAICLLNRVLQNKYGSKYLHYRGYFTQGSADDTPLPEFLSDTLHYKDVGERLIGQIIRDACVRTGYADIPGMHSPEVPPYPTGERIGQNKVSVTGLTPTASTNVLVIEPGAYLETRIKRIIITPGIATAAGTATLTISRNSVAATAAGTAVAPIAMQRDKRALYHTGIVRRGAFTVVGATSVATEHSIPIPTLTTPQQPFAIDVDITIPAGVTNGLMFAHSGLAGAADFGIAVEFEE